MGTLTATTLQMKTTVQIYVQFYNGQRNMLVNALITAPKTRVFVDLSTFSANQGCAFQPLWSVMVGVTALNGKMNITVLILCGIQIHTN